MFAALALQSSLAAALAAELDPAAASGALVSAYVCRLDGTLIYEKNSAVRVMPASNQKLFSTSYAFSQLGPDFRCRTRMWKEKGTLVVDAPGHPTLKYEELTAAAKALGMQSTVAVRQAYKPQYPPDWELNDLPNRYAAPICAFTVDRGSFELWSDKGKGVLLPQSYGVSVVSLPGKELKVSYDPFQRVVRVYGPIPKEKTLLDTLAVPKPDAAAASLLGKQPVPFSGEVPTRDPDLVLESAPLTDILRECLQKSDNNLAENLLLMAAASEGPLGDDVYDDACKRLKKFLVTKVGLEEGDLHPVDGSGMSRHNLTTSRALAKMLAYTRRTWGDVYYSCLAVPKTGTLSNRLEGSSFHGKTGSLDNVSSLTGIVKGADGQELVVSLVLNHFTESAANIRALQDKVVRIIEQPLGTLFDVPSCYREVSLSVPRNRPVYGNRLRGSHFHGGAALSGSHR